MMAEPVTPDIMAGFRELLREFRGVAHALGEVVERTARLETKVDRLITDQARTDGMQARICDLENWFRTEMSARNARSAARGLWTAVLATLLGGGVGAVIAHVWK